MFIYIDGLIRFIQLILTMMNERKEIFIVVFIYIRYNLFLSDEMICFYSIRTDRYHHVLLATHLTETINIG